MIITREEFIREFTLYLERKLSIRLPEEDFAYSMLEQSIEIINGHNGEIIKVLGRPD